MWIWSRGLLHRSLTVCSPSELQTNCGIRAIYNLLAMDLFSCFQKSFLLSTPISWTWFGWEWDHSGGDSSTSQSILSLLSPHPLERGCQRGRALFCGLISSEALWQFSIWEQLWSSPINDEQIPPWPAASCSESSWSWWKDSCCLTLTLLCLQMLPGKGWFPLCSFHCHR